MVDDDGWFQPAGDDRGRGMWWLLLQSNESRGVAAAATMAQR